MGNQPAARPGPVRPPEHRSLRLRLDPADDLRTSWAALLVAEVATELGWAVADADGDGGLPDAVAVLGPTGTSAPSSPPALVIVVEEGTSRSPAIEESAPHLPARLDLLVGAFKARRNQRVTRAAIERFLERVETERAQAADAAERTSPAGPGQPDHEPARAAPPEPASAAVRRTASLELLDAVDGWLARTTMTPESAQAVHADRAILAAAIGAPVIDEVIVERASARLTAALGA